MANLFSGDIDAFPEYKTLSISMFPIEEYREDEVSYEVELPRDLKTLTSFLCKLRVQSEPGVPCSNYTTMAQDVLSRHTGTFYTDSENINEIIERYRQDFTPEQEFPGGSEPNLMDFFISESTILKEDILLQGKLVPAGTPITFHHKGNLNGLRLS
jgi:hypothetical protein